MPKKRRVLITGAAGNVGGKLVAELTDYDLRLVDLHKDGNPDIHVRDLSQWYTNLPPDQTTLVELLEGVDVVIHLAAIPDETRSWDQLIGPNLIAVDNLLDAARVAGVPRFVFASSSHAMGGYRNDLSIPKGGLTTSLPPKPGVHDLKHRGRYINSDAYGTLKLVAEQLGANWALRNDRVFVGIRLGWVLKGANRYEDLSPGNGPENDAIWYVLTWLSTGDLGRLFRAALLAPLPLGTSCLVNGMSKNAGMPWSLTEGEEFLGYVPQDGIPA